MSKPLTGTSTTSATIHKTPNGREFVRTPDDCFKNLPDFPYSPNYVEVDGLRLHYVDEGPKDGQVCRASRDCAGYDRHGAFRQTDRHSYAHHLCPCGLVERDD